MNLLLQHWTGELGLLETMSSKNMAEYAKFCNADYSLLRGNYFRPHLSPPCQKLAMLDERFDDYDVVVMVDMDMFAVNGLTENVFELEGTGLFSEYTQLVFQKCREYFPDLTDPRYAYWGGAIYRLTREMRRKLRVHINENEMARFSARFQDEGIMHRLASLAKVPQDRLPDRWCQCSYRPNPEKAAMIHVREKVTPTGPRRPKLENYFALNGIIQ